MLSPPVCERNISDRLSAAMHNCTMVRNLRRSRMSASTPAGMASRKTGSVPAAWIIATAAGPPPSSVTSHELLTSRMKLPVLPRMVAIQITANVVCRSGAKLLDGVATALPGHGHVALRREACLPRGDRCPAAPPGESRRPARDARRSRWPPSMLRRPETFQNALASRLAARVKPASASARQQRRRPRVNRISALASSSSAITAAANSGAGARPKCCISPIAAGKSSSLSMPPCR